MKKLFAFPLALFFSIAAFTQQRKGGGKMQTRGCILAALLIFLLVPGIGAQMTTQDSTATLAIVGGRLIDGFGGPPINRTVIIVAGDRVSAVGRLGELPVPQGVKTIDASGYTVMPGLMDMHVHLMLVGHGDYNHWFTTYQPRFRDEIMPIAARQFLMAGVTTVRDLGAPLDDIITVRDRIARGEIPGSRLFVAGPFLQHAVTPVQAAFRWAVKGVDDARTKTQQLLKAGVDWIKVIDQDLMTMEEFEAIVQTAHAAGKPVAVHAHKVEEIRRALIAGVDCLEHTSLRTMPEYPADLMEMVTQRNARLYWCTTLEPFFMYQDTLEHPERVDDQRLKADLPPDIYKDVHDSLSYPPGLEYYRYAPRRLPTLKRKFGQIMRSGTTIVVGTDSGIPLNFNFDCTWRELAAMVHLGMKPMNAILAATLWPGRMLRRPDIGTIAPGKIADLIVIDGDPLANIENLRHVVHVVKDGKQYK